MGFRQNYNIASLAFTLLLFSVTLIFSHPDDDTFVTSRATYYGSPDCLGNPTGACGYGEYGRTINDGKVAGVARLWRNGTGCGACYQVKCTNSELCSDDGTYVVVTDYGEGHHTDFILSPAAYAEMAEDDKAAHLLYSYGVVEIQFRRVACRYAGYTLAFKVHERSYNPHYLAIVIVHVSGRNDVLAVEAWQADCNEWRPMRRAFGAVFDLENPPRGVINLRLLVSGSAGYTWVEAANAIAADWKAGVTYETQIVLN